MILTYEMLKKSLARYKVCDNKIKRMCDKKEIVKLTKNLYKFLARKPMTFRTWDEWR